MLAFIVYYKLTEGKAKGKIMRKTNGFTLLLVVIAIMAILLSVLMSSLTKAKEQSKKVVCSSCFHTFGSIVQYSVGATCLDLVAYRLQE